MTFIKHFKDIEKITRKLSRKGWRIVYVDVEHEDGEKPVAVLKLQYDPQKLSDVL